MPSAASAQLERALTRRRLRGRAGRPRRARVGLVPRAPRAHRRRRRARRRCRGSLPGARSQVGLRLHGVADPGNVGTLVRAADVLGPAHIVLGEGTADPLAPKAVRASMGALFRVPIVRLARRASCAQHRPGRASRDARSGTASSTPPIAFELGAERAGLPDTIARSADARRGDPACARRRVAQRRDGGSDRALRAPPEVALTAVVRRPARSAQAARSDADLAHPDPHVAHARRARGRRRPAAQARAVPGHRARSSPVAPTARSHRWLPPISRAG